ncbi:tetratricopeptide repeat protein [Pedobacter riviphilus]|uniref:Tetratricopeptide repeat protein n=1 Tax=Pedobacter riviphilus TaxID=2766984 RepID=A0ABX6TGI0_9SPHI|nr:MULTISPECIES: tetratricopeptide repeat protein [Pedobacter]NII85859.1 putative Zn-dependent protease [Pedobacter sp. SG908]NMN39226.1 putative Zn-dependent protease [Pedobacter sp. SG918]QNR83757.1 tetratricopeptide repeat protein [Pedobacter riviphilus]
MNRFFFIIFLFLSLGAKAQIFRPNQQIAPDESSLAIQYYQDGEYEKAVVLLEKLYAIPNNEAYFDIYFNTLLKLKRYDVAEKVVKREVKKNPQNDVYPIALGKLYQEKGDTQSSNKIFSDVISNLPKDEFKIRNLANSFYRFENYDFAVQTFKQGRKLLGNDQMFTFELLNIYRFKKDKPMLMQEYLDALGTMPQLLPQAEAVLSSIFEDKNDYQTFQTAILRKVQKEPDAEIYIQLLTWNYIQQQEFDMALRQLIAYDKRTKADGGTLFNAIYTFVDNGAYETAIKAYDYLLTKGKDNQYYLPSKIEMLNTKYNLRTNGKYTVADLDLLAKDYQALLDENGKNRNTLFAIKKLANLQAYYLNQPGSAEKELEEAIKMPGINDQDLGQLKLDLGDIYILTNQPWEAFLVYEQVSKQFEGQPVGNEARFRSAKLSFYQGNFEYSNAQCLVLKAATSQLIANDALNLSLLINDNIQTPADSNALKMYADAEMLLFRNLPERAVKKMDSIAIAFPQNSLTDAIMMSKARILIKANDFQKAADILKKVTEDFKDGIWTDDALFTLGDLYEKKLNDIAQAKIYFQKLITDYPGSMFSAEARKRFRNLRGDGV